MKAEERFQKDVVDEVLQWDSTKIYSVFGPFLEKVVEDKKAALRKELKTILKNRRWYAFRDTSTQFEDKTMLLYFNPKQIIKYRLMEMEDILEKLEREATYSNPNRKYK